MATPNDAGGVLQYDKINHDELINIEYDNAGHFSFEPAFSKNSGFNLPLGITSETVSEGNHTHSGYEPKIVKNSAFNCSFGSSINDICSGLHTHSYESVITTKNNAFNVDFGTIAGTAARGNHEHRNSNGDNIYLPYYSKCTAWNRDFGTTALTVARGNHNHDALYSLSGHNHDLVYSKTTHTHTEYSLSTHTHTGNIFLDYFYALPYNNGVYNKVGTIYLGDAGRSKNWGSLSMLTNTRIDCWANNDLLIDSGTNIYFATSQIVGAIESNGDFRWEKNVKVGLAFNGTYDVWTHDAGAHVSDIRFKKNISSLDGETCLTMINNLTPVKYKWIDGNTKYNFGLIAQDVETVIPNDTDIIIFNEEKYCLRYTELIAPIIKSIQELKHQIDEL